MAGNADRLGIYGFGAAGHIVAQVARWQGRSVYAFTRSDDIAAQDFARRLGAVWAGASGELPDAPLDAAIIFAPVGWLVPAALLPADASLVMQLGAEAVFVGSGIFKSSDPATRAAAVVEAAAAFAAFAARKKPA